MPTAPHNQPLVKKRSVNVDRVCERALKTWKTCDTANVMNAIVVARRRPSPSSPCHCIPIPNANSVTDVSSNPCQTIRPMKRSGSNDSFGSRGGRFMTSGADGSNASANAGKMSVIKLSHNICRATRGSGQPIMSAINTVRISEKLQESR